MRLEGLGVYLSSGYNWFDIGGPIMVLGNVIIKVCNEMG
jgi:hypothetical protein